MRVRLQVLSACLLAAAIPAAWPNGGGSMGSMNVPQPREQTPEEKAKDLYNDGVRAVKKADKAETSAEQLTDAGKKERAQRDAHKYYTEALTKFRGATQNDSRLHEAWNYLGYTSRRLGNYDDALVAYERALSLRPGYPDALEYRGEAYLALNRVDDAKHDYLDLFATNRGLADKLLGAMKSWLATQRASSSADATQVSELDKWIQERAQIAGQTAALTREGTAASWH